MKEVRHKSALKKDAKTHLEEIIDHVSHLLPMQGPIGVFIHHNTLHAFQHLSFEAAVCEAMQKFGTEPYLSEEQYQKERQKGRILDEDIDAILDSEANTLIWPRLLTRRTLRRAMLIPGLRRFVPENIEWYIDEVGLLEKLRSDLSSTNRNLLLENKTESAAARTLFAACFCRVPPLKPFPSSRAARVGEALLNLTGVNIDEEVHPLLIRLAALFLDQGLAYWPMPDREKGFYKAVRDLMSQPIVIEPELLAGLQKQWSKQISNKMEATDVVLHYLDLFGVEEKDWEGVLAAELLALPGWAGLMRRLEKEPLLAPHDNLPCSLLDFLAVRLTLTAVAAEKLWQKQKIEGSLWAQWRIPSQEKAVSEAEQMVEVARLFDLVQLLGISASQLNSLSTNEFKVLYKEFCLFNELERRRVLHLAYERRHEQLILQPLYQHRKEVVVEQLKRPKAQVIFCIDEREESIRRAVEELDSEVETLGAAGFFGIAVNYQGVDDAHGVALCPVVVKPQHAVEEKVVGEDQKLYKQRQSLRRLWSLLAHNSYVGSRTLLRGWVGTTGFGLLSIFPLLTRVLAPWRAKQMYNWLSRQFLPQPRTELTLMRQTEKAQKEGLLIGFSAQEKAERVASVLRPAGLVSNLSRLVVVLGHGSTSLNNPHESAHDCGACGGRRGGPNARLFAAMANDPEVRLYLKKLGVEIPVDTWFVGGYHDTCNDDIEFFDQTVIEATHKKEFAEICKLLDKARAANALERSRRFEAAWAATTPAKALRHVQERSEHLAEPRPEYGHATNAVCIVGRRSMTRGLFLDRRAFLVSYDPECDSDSSSLAALLAAAVPVCAGINLEYYFSFVDNERYGCGTKLPHNVTGLVGVMNGHASDLRTGLPWQMVEIHEPVRLLMIVETTPERLINIMAKNPTVAELVKNRWIRLATIDPLNGQIEVYRENSFEPFTADTKALPEIDSSVDWYRNKLDHLPIARIKSAAVGVQRNGI